MLAYEFFYPVSLVQRAVTTDSELNDAVATVAGAGFLVPDTQKVLRLYLVPKGTTPSLMASMAAPSAPAASSNNNVLDVDLTPLLNTLTGGNAGANPLASLISLLSRSQQQQEPASTSAGPQSGSDPKSTCPFLSGTGATYICDSCNMSPIAGTVHQCDTCPDFHLCDPCKFRGVHQEKNHTFTMNPTRPNGASRCGRWDRRPHHHGWNHPGAQQPAAPGAGASPVASPLTTNEPQQPSPAPIASSPIASPIVAPIPTSPFGVLPTEIPKKPITVIPAPFLPVQPVKPQIVETTPNSSPIVPPAQLVPSDLLEMAFLSDVTIPDGTEFSVGEGFSKVWRLSNSGTTTWPLGCRLVLETNTGDRLSTVEYVDIPGEVPPQSAVTISVEMETPKKLGRHVSYWRMQGPSGSAFGARIWVDIVATPKKVPVAPAVVAAPAVPEPIPAAPAAPASGIKPGEKFSAQLESLYRMGFLNLDLNRNLLEHNKGNVAAVVDQLFSFSQH